MTEKANVRPVLLECVYADLERRKIRVVNPARMSEKELRRLETERLFEVWALRCDSDADGRHRMQKQPGSALLRLAASPVRQAKPPSAEFPEERNRELGLREIPVVKYPVDEDPVRLALRRQENDEGVQPWDFLDRAFLVKKLYHALGTQEKVAARLGWKQPQVSNLLRIAELPGEIITEIQVSVIKAVEDAVIDD